MEAKCTNTSVTYWECCKVVKLPADMMVMTAVQALTVNQMLLDGYRLLSESEDDYEEIKAELLSKGVQL